MSAYLSSLTPVFTRHTYALRESIDVSRSSTKAIGLAADPQCCCRSIPWGQYLPADPDLMDWLFGEDVRTGLIGSPFDIGDVWPSSYSGNTNEILWAAKVGASFMSTRPSARCPDRSRTVVRRA